MDCTMRPGHSSTLTLVTRLPAPLQVSILAVNRHSQHLRPHLLEFLIPVGISSQLCGACRQDASRFLVRPQRLLSVVSVYSWVASLNAKLRSRPATLLMTSSGCNFLAAGTDGSAPHVSLYDCLATAQQQLLQNGLQRVGLLL